MIVRTTLMIAALVCSFFYSHSQSTSWRGTTSTAWNNTSNWTNGVPNASKDVILGDANFTGGNQPTVNATASCKSLTIGGTISTILTLSKNITVSGSVVINSNATVNNGSAAITLSGNWTNNGTYNTTNGNARVVFAGVSQTIGGSASTTFRCLRINAGSTVTLTTNITTTGTSSYLYVYGVLNPGESPTYTVTSTVKFRVFDNGRIKVNAPTFGGNYILSGTTTLSAGSIVEYAATTSDQTVSNSYTYSTLVISGAGTTKNLTGNLPALNSSSATRGNIFVNSGTLDLSTFTANRGTSKTGGEINVANGATLKIGGTNSFPSNYNSRVLGLNSTVEYYGTNQAVSAQTYGNLILSSSSGSVTKTMPATIFTVEGNFTSNLGPGTAVLFTSASNITFNGDVTIGSGTTFNGGSHTHTVRGNWINDGTFTGGTGTVVIDGSNKTLSGTGAHNFHNMTISSTGVTGATGTSFTLSGNLATTGAGQFTHNSAGSVTMNGSSKTISGSNIILFDLTVSGSVTTNASFTINGNLSVSGSVSCSGGTITMAGSSKTISGAGAIGFSGLYVSGSITTGSDFSISSSLDVTGSITATSGTATFTGSSILTGTANLYNVTVNGTSLQLSFLSEIGVANTFTISSGMLDVTTSTPNTVNFNGTGAQSVNAITYHHLSISNSNTKTATGGITVNGNLTIATGATFNGSSYSHNVLRNWINNGTYIASSGTVQFSGSLNATLSGSTTFNTLAVNKSSASISLTLQNSITAASVAMTSGTMLTGSNTITITSSRTGNGIILGNITRTHAFTTGTAYAFEGPDNTITFSAVSGVTSVSVSVSAGNIADFPNGAAINREYTISVPAGTYTATLQLHYEDAELNGNDESIITLWDYSGGWAEIGKTGNSTTTNYAEQSGLTNISSRWTCSETPGVVRWNGAVSPDWNNASNWTLIGGTPSMPPSSTDIVQIGTGAFTNQPVISNPVTVKGIVFGSVQTATLTLGTGGSLTTNGNISGSWSANGVHTIITGNQNLTVNGNLALSDGTSNHSIDLTIGNGVVTVLGILSQSGNAAINFTGTGTLNIGDNFNYTSGTFTAGAGNVIYNGTGTQIISAHTYNNLTINKTSGVATHTDDFLITGNLSVISGSLNLSESKSVTVAGNVSISSGATIYCDGATLSVGGDWSNSGTYYSSMGYVVFNGTGLQSISSAAFNHLTINKASGTALLSGNITLEGNLYLQSGTLDLGTNTANRSSTGGNFTISAGTTLLVAGSNNFPSGFVGYDLNAASLVHYNGTGTQSVAGRNYGNLVFSNGGVNAKSLLADAVISGDITINSGATFQSGGYTIELSGNWTNNGTFTPSTGTIVLGGASKTITGNTNFNNLTVTGSYTVAGSDITYNGHLHVTPAGSYSAGSGTAIVNGDLTNEGSLISTGITNFTGTTVQTLRLVNALTSSSTGVVNFDGTVSPIMNSTSSPQFATLNINNTAGINPSVGWTVFVAMNVNAGGIFNGGFSTHTVYGSFTNNGTVTSTGTIQFTPTSAKTINFGTSGFTSDGIVKLGGSGQVTLSGIPQLFTHLIISNTNSAGISPNTNWAIDSNFVITSNAIFNAGSYTYTVGGDLQSDGTLNGSASTFVMTSSLGGLTTSSETEFNHFTITGTLTPQTDFRVAGNFTNDGMYDGAIGVLIMTGSNVASIGGTTAPSSIAQLTIEKTGGAIVTQNASIQDVLFLNINSGVLFTSTNNITQDAGGGILLIADGATLRLGGTNSLPGFSGYSLDVNSNVDYAGTTQAIGNAANYGNLLITAAGNKNALVPFVVLGDLTISAGTLATSTITVTHAIAGDFVMSGGSITGTSSTYVLNGTSDQALTLISNLVNLTVNKSAGVVNLGSNVTVNNVTNFTLGKINLGDFSFIVGSSGSITNYNATKYFIATGNGTLVQRVSNGGSKIFPVGFTNEYLPATIALTAGSAADDFSVRLLTSVYYDGTSGSQFSDEVVNATWMIAEIVAGGSDATITLQWPQSLELASFNRTACRLAHYQGGQWELGAADLAASGSDPYTVSRSGFTGFSPFAVGGAEVLPVTWLDVSGEHKNGSNHIYWTTANEYNNSYFVVEASVNGNDFFEAGRVKSNSNNNGEQHQYLFIHSKLISDLYYYRIRQVDVGGSYSYSKVIKISGRIPAVAVYKIYPNPVKDKATLEIIAKSPLAVYMTLSDISGKVLITKIIQLSAGLNKEELVMTGLAGGIYILNIKNDDHIIYRTERIIKR